MKNIIDKFEAKEIAESMFEFVLEEVEDWKGVSYQDLSSISQESYLRLVKKNIDILFEKELQKIKDEWTNESTEMRQLRNENERLKVKLAMANMDFGEDMGK